MAVDDYIKALEDRGAPDVRTARYDLDAHVLTALGEIAVSAFRRPRISAWRAAIASSRRRARIARMLPRTGKCERLLTGLRCPGIGSDS